jgi:glycine cleavage system regulatory protein
MVLDWLYTGRRLSVLPDTSRDVVRRSDAFKIVLGISIESGRCQVTVEAIQEHFQQFAAGIENVPAGFTFHADASRFQDFADPREVEVIVSAAFEYDSINIPSSRSKK